jgi:hypothetical protein
MLSTNPLCAGIPIPASAPFGKLYVDVEETGHLGYETFILAIFRQHLVLLATCSRFHYFAEEQIAPSVFWKN